MLSERYPVLWVGQAAVVSAPVEVDVTNVGDVHRCLVSTIGNGARVLVVDMTATTFCDCAGVHAIVACLARTAAEGVPLRLAVSTPAVRYLFTVTGAARILDVRPTVAAALIGPS